MNLPGVVVDLPTLTDKDVTDLKGFALTNKVDFIAASFVRKPQDLDNIREVRTTASAIATATDVSASIGHCVASALRIASGLASAAATPCSASRLLVLCTS